MLVESSYQKKEDWTMPTLAESQPYCSAMGMMAMLMFTLSMLHSMKAMKQSPMMVHRRFQPLVLVATCVSQGGNQMQAFKSLCHSIQCNNFVARPHTKGQHASHDMYAELPAHMHSRCMSSQCDATVPTRPCESFHMPTQPHATAAAAQRVLH